MNCINPNQFERQSPEFIGPPSTRLGRIENEFDKLFQTASFVEQCVNQSTATEAKAIESVQKKITKTVNKKMGAITDEMACRMLDVSSIEEGRKKGKEWGMAKKEAQKKLQNEGVKIVVHEIESTLPFDRAQEEIVSQTQKEYSSELSEAEGNLEEAKNIIRSNIKLKGKVFIEAFADVDFQNSLLHWGDSPALDGDIKHAGMVHFIEYRSENPKRIAKLGKEFSPKGFQEYTSDLMKLANNPNSEDIKEAVRLNDETGGERLLIYTKKGDYISLFRKDIKSEWQIITHIPEVKAKAWEKTKENMKQAEAQKKYHNRLEGEIHEKMLLKDPKNKEELERECIETLSELEFQLQKVIDNSEAKDIMEDEGLLDSSDEYDLDISNILSIEEAIKLRIVEYYSSESGITECTAWNLDNTDIPRLLAKLSELYQFHENPGASGNLDKYISPPSGVNHGDVPYSIFRNNREEESILYNLFHSKKQRYGHLRTPIIQETCTSDSTNIVFFNIKSEE